MIFTKTSQSLSNILYVWMKANTCKYCSQLETAANSNKCSILEIRRAENLAGTDGKCGSLVSVKTRRVVASHWLKDTHTQRHT